VCSAVLRNLPIILIATSKGSTIHYPGRRGSSFKYLFRFSQSDPGSLAMKLLNTVALVVVGFGWAPSLTAGVAGYC
jgi:hypothetical protein